MALVIGIATLGVDGINRIATSCPPRIEDVRYLISWQQDRGNPVPKDLLRDDIKILLCDKKGVASNRNNIIEHVSHDDVILCSDDDVKFNTEGILKLVNIFEENPSLDVAALICRRPGGPVYPTTSLRLGKHLPKNYWISATEIAFRNDKGLRFDERFGPNSGVFEAGEDEKFMIDARKQDYDCRFFPIVIATHRSISTGSKLITDSKTLHAAGAIIKQEYPVSYIPRLVLKAWRMRKRCKMPIQRILIELFKGARI